MNTKNHPGIYVPPPLIYAAFFLISIFLQKRWPLDTQLLTSTAAHVIGWVLGALYLLFFLVSMRRFMISKNTIVTIKPATSLETTGIYSITRNPMYLSLLLLYGALAVFIGNWWTFLMLPPLILIIQGYVIRKEEAYLHQAFGPSYEVYRQKVRRWF